jgi:hypothetical protein
MFSLEKIPGIYNLVQKLIQEKELMKILWIKELYLNV